MDPTTADFNAWLAEEGAKVGATVLPQGPPDNFLRGYGQGYQVDLGTDSAYDPTTADILAKAQAGGAFPNWLRSIAPEVLEADDSHAGSGIASRIDRTLTGIAHGGLNTMANWLDKTPKVGPDTIAPLGLAPMGMALTPRNAVGAMGDAARLARAREIGFDTDRTLYHGSIEPKPFDEFDLSHTGRNQGNDGFWGKGVYSTRERGVAKSYADYGGGPMAETYQPGHVRDLYSRAKKTFVVDHDNFADAQKLAAKIYPDAPLKTHGFLDPKDIEGWTKALKRHGYDSVEVKGRGVEHEWVDLDPRNLRDTKAAFDPAHSNSAGLLLSDQSKASLPGTVINSVDAAGPRDTLNKGLTPSEHGSSAAAARQEQPFRAAIKIGDEIFEGYTHGDAITAAERAKGSEWVWKHHNMKDGFGPESEGFVTTSGRYVGRKEAMDLLGKDKEYNGNLHASSLNELKRDKPELFKSDAGPRDTAAAAALPERGVDHKKKDKK